MSTPEECVLLDIPQGLRLNLLGLIVQIDRVRIVADRASLLGGLLASLTCGGIESVERLEALAQVIRSQSGTERRWTATAGTRWPDMAARPKLSRREGGRERSHGPPPSLSHA
jgi:hypothetical protein